MTDAPEIPEAEDPFAKRIAITIAALAVLISVIGNKGDNAKTESILKTTEAANQWGYYQAKSLKSHAYSVASEELEVLAVADPAKRDALVKSFAAKVAKYEQEKQDIGFGQQDAGGAWKQVLDDHGQPVISARQLRAETDHASAINDRCDLGSLLLQIAVILCSVAILVRLHSFWFLGMAVGSAGAVVGVTAFLM